MGADVRADWSADNNARSARFVDGLPHSRQRNNPQNVNQHGVAQQSTAKASFIYDSFASLVKNDYFPCLGARSALRRGTLRFGVYPEMTYARATLGLLADLWSFISEFPRGGESLATFVAVFDGPATSSEEQFENLLWRQLQELHDLDVIESGWAHEVSRDPHEPSFSFSVGGRGLFVVGLHPAASRWSRRFSWPTLVFNPHDQFVTLRRERRMEGMKSAIRKRDRRLQGSDNPVLDDHGQSSEARQYSGRAVENDWKCPFQPDAETGYGHNT